MKLTEVEHEFLIFGKIFGGVFLMPVDAAIRFVKAHIS